MIFADAMRGLTGARLAALDALQKLGGAGGSAVRVALSCERHDAPVVVEAIGWLCAHHFATQVAPGLFRARDVPVAAECFERAGGPLNEFMQGLRVNAEPVNGVRSIATGRSSAASAPDFIPANAAPSGVRVQDYQVQMFADV